MSTIFYIGSTLSSLELHGETDNKVYTIRIDKDSKDVEYFINFKNVKLFNRFTFPKTETTKKLELFFNDHKDDFIHLCDYYQLGQTILYNELYYNLKISLENFVDAMKVKGEKF